MQEFQQTHEKEGTSRFAVNKSDEPFVFADLIGQKIFAEDGQVTGTKDGKPYTQHHKKGSTAQMWFEFAQGGREIPLDKESYLIWRCARRYVVLALDAPGGDAQVQAAAAQRRRTIRPFRGNCLASVATSGVLVERAGRVRKHWRKHVFLEAHNPKAAGSNPAHATNLFNGLRRYAVAS